jgi:hypothetical protein
MAFVETEVPRSYYFDTVLQAELSLIIFLGRPVRFPECGCV